MKKWLFWLDRGGTFTDVVAVNPQGQILTHKLLSDNPKHYANAAIQGIRDLLQLSPEQALPTETIAEVRMGTTLGTNALLERKGEAVVLAITQGFADALRIGYQNRPDIFALNIQLPDSLYQKVIEIPERIASNGDVVMPLNLQISRWRLKSAYDAGFRCLAVLCLHGYRYPQHELAMAELAQQIGFTQISLSHQVSPLEKLISRGDTTVVDAYLTPVLQRYVDSVLNQLNHCRLLFMQSCGGLVEGTKFRGRDSILSGPAGGIVGMVTVSQQAGFNQIIGFDMGGTSTDVSHFNGHYAQQFETQVAGVRMAVPMLAIHTVAAGGGSLVHFDGLKFQVGPDSAGANPGPACYRQHGGLTVTDCNLLLGRLQADYFPKVFGDDGRQGLDCVTVSQQFQRLTQQINHASQQNLSPYQVAEGFLHIAIDNMAQAIKKISVQAGYDVSDYLLCCFGGAGGQHACAVADALGMKKILLHPYAGVLSAYGMGQARLSCVYERSVNQRLTADNLQQLQTIIETLRQQAQQHLQQQAVENMAFELHCYLRYSGTDHALLVLLPYSVDVNCAEIRQQFKHQHQQRYGFVREHNDIEISVLAVSARDNGVVEAISPALKTQTKPTTAVDFCSLFYQGRFYHTPIYLREDLTLGTKISGVALIIEATGTHVLAPDWQLSVLSRGELLLQRQGDSQQPQAGISTALNPIHLEIFSNLFMSIAEQMGATLANTASSVNIKERLDFSCAVFDQHGQLVANAPHVPVHLGSMGDSVVAVLNSGQSIHANDVFVLNNPYQGGTHLPDITVVTPVFIQADKPLFFLASRGHHADIGGISAGSMPPHSQHIEQEGVLIDVFKLVENGEFQQQKILHLLTHHRYPARNPQQNIADLKAQIAANQKGVYELSQMVVHFGLAVVQAYMQHVQDHASNSIQRVIETLSAGEFQYRLDNQSHVQVKISVNRQQRTAIVDFTGTSPQQSDNFNAPASVCKAAVLYVFRTLVKENIPLNAGCLKPLQIIIPKNSMLNPCYPAAVAAGNVEVSQVVTDALYGALGIMAASQGTMNNFTFGNQDYQYYETICGGSGAGNGFNGANAVQTHMTNSRLTDPEILEQRFPVSVENFSIRRGSGGKGLYRGGHGVIREIKFQQTLQAAILSNRRTIPPYGMAGGQAGQVGENSVKRADGSIEILNAIDEVTMQAGDTFIIKTPAGGGFGKSEI